MHFYACKVDREKPQDRANYLVFANWILERNKFSKTIIFAIRHTFISPTLSINKIIESGDVWRTFRALSTGHSLEDRLDSTFSKMKMGMPLSSKKFEIVKRLQTFYGTKLTMKIMCFQEHGVTCYTVITCSQCKPNLLVVLSRGEMICISCPDHVT